MRALRPEECTGGDIPIGLFTLAGFAVPPAVPVPTLSWLRDSPHLVVPPPGGPPTHDPDHVRRIARELSVALGGAFADLTDQLTLVTGLASLDERASYGLGDDPTVYGWLAVALNDDWQVQALAIAGKPYLVSLIRPLAESEAVAEGGHPRHRPLGDPGPLLNQFAPAVRVPNDVSDHYDPALFDAVLAGPEARVRGGVRRRLGTEGRPAMNSPCCYVIRVDLPLP